MLSDGRSLLFYLELIKTILGSLCTVASEKQDVSYLDSGGVCIVSFGGILHSIEELFSIFYFALESIGKQC